MFASPFKDGLIVLVILLLFFGPKRLPALSRSIGESIKEFKGGISENSSKADEPNHEIPAARPTEPVITTSEPTGTGSESKSS
jgi:sec-independent protein translocase protein TatA